MKKKRIKPPPPVPAHRSRSLAPLAAGIVLLILAAGVVSVRIRLLSAPLERDEGVYAYFGKLVLEGKTPYIDFYEDKPPGNYYTYAALIALFGYTAEGLHVAFVLVNLASILLLFGLAARLWGTGPGLIAAGVFAFLSLGHRISGFTAQSEFLVVLFALAGFLILQTALTRVRVGPQRTESPPATNANRVIPRPAAALLFFISGAHLCWSVCIKQSGLFFFLTGVCAILFSPGARTVAAKIRDLLWYALGALVVTAVLVLMLAGGGALGGCWSSMVDLPLHFVSRSHHDWVPDLYYAFRYISENGEVFWLAGLAGLVLWIRQACKRRLLIFLISSCLLTILTVLPGFTFYGHYWIQTLPALALLNGALVAMITRTAVHRLKTKPVTVYCSLGIVYGLLVLAAVGRKEWYFYSANMHKTSRRVYGNNPFPECKVIGAFLDARTRDGESLAVFGSEPQLFVYARCRNVSRHTFFPHLFETANPAHGAWQREYIGDVERAQPKYVVFVDNSNSWMVQPGSETLLLDWAEPYLNRNYEIIGVADIIDSLTTRYVWGEEAVHYRVAGSSVVLLYKRASRSTPPGHEPAPMSTARDPDINFRLPDTREASDPVALPPTG